MKDVFDVLISRLDSTEERICELKDMFTETQKEKPELKNNQISRNSEIVSNNIKCA